MRGDGSSALWSSRRPDCNRMIKEKKSSSGMVGPRCLRGDVSGRALRWSSSLVPYYQSNPKHGFSKLTSNQKNEYELKKKKKGVNRTLISKETKINSVNDLTWHRISISKKFSSGRAAVSSPAGSDESRRKISGFALFKPGRRGSDALCSSMRRLCMPAMRSSRSSFNRDGLSTEIPKRETVSVR